MFENEKNVIDAVVEPDWMGSFCIPGEMILQGLTHQGKVFRPSDWHERLCGSLSKMDRGRLIYHPWLRPLMVDGVHSVAFAKELKEKEPFTYDFLINFAKENDLRCFSCEAPLPPLQEGPMCDLFQNKNESMQ